jgi:hypothetical protein
MMDIAEDVDAPQGEVAAVAGCGMEPEDRG